MKTNKIRLLVASLSTASAMASQVASAEETAASAAPVVEPTPLPVTAGYDKGFFIKSADEPFKLNLGGRLQARFTWAGLQEEPNEAFFSIPRARFHMKGYAFTKDLTYKFQADFGKGFTSLKDFYAQYAFIPKVLELRVGQFKRPFARQQINSSGKLEFVDRAITDKSFEAGRDIGFMVSDNYEKSPEFEYALGLFNGTGAAPWFSGKADEGRVSGKFTNVPDRFRPALVFRVGYNYGGIKGYSEPDLEGGGFRLAVGGSGMADFDVNDEASDIRGELDFILKYEGLSVSSAVFLSTNQTGAEFFEQKYAKFGLYAQLGYVINGLVQPVLRYALVAPNSENNPDGIGDTTEATGGVSLYFFKNKFKWQTDAGLLMVQKDDAPTQKDYVVRSQLQLTF